MRTRIIVLLALSVLGCERRERAPGAAPQLWEALDESFRGCEGG